MRETILRELDRIEDDFDVRVLFASEGGSRAWGFPSVDSDYDVRFVYIHQPIWYLSILDGRDVIERPVNDGLDISGWDAKKALRLFRKSNPSLIEWINSPIIYDDRLGFAERLRQILDQYFSETVCSYHYLHMAKGNFRDYLIADTVWVKKYFYVLRPLLAVEWMEQGRGVVPVDFNELVREIDAPEYLKTEIYKLIKEKKAGKELGRGKKNHIISAYIEKALDEKLKKNYACPKPPAPLNLLNDLFLEYLGNGYKGKVKDVEVPRFVHK